MVLLSFLYPELGLKQKDDRLAIWHFIISKIIFPRRLRRKFNDAFYNSLSPHDVLITHSCLIFRWEVLNSESGHHHSSVVSKIVDSFLQNCVIHEGHLGTSFDINTALHPSPANVDWQIKGWSVSANWCFPTPLHFRFNASLSLSDDNISDRSSLRQIVASPRLAGSCPTCHVAYDRSARVSKMSELQYNTLSRGNKRRLVDSCGHERCYSCIGRNEKCALCIQMGGQFQI